MQENGDQNLNGTEWSIKRDGNVINIHTNFESPASEFGATYEIKIFKDTFEAEKEWNKVAAAHPGPESQWGENMICNKKLNASIAEACSNRYIGLMNNIDLGLGQINNVYTLIPGGVDGRGKSQKPLQKHIFVYAQPDTYRSYIEQILIPSIKIK